MAKRLESAFHTGGDVEAQLPDVVIHSVDLPPQPSPSRLLPLPGSPCYSPPAAASPEALDAEEALSPPVPEQSDTPPWRNCSACNAADGKAEKNAALLLPPGVHPAAYILAARLGAKMMSESIANSSDPSRGSTPEVALPPRWRNFLQSMWQDLERSWRVTRQVKAHNKHALHLIRRCKASSMS